VCIGVLEEQKGKRQLTHDVCNRDSSSSIRSLISSSERDSGADPPTARRTRREQSLRRGARARARTRKHNGELAARTVTEITSTYTTRYHDKELTLSESNY